MDGTICAKEFRVSLSGSPCWADFVFDEDYELMPLEKLEADILNNKHLPDIPSSEEVTENGIALGEMQAKLLQKIEELTLYAIELKKEINILKLLKNRRIVIYIKFANRTARIQYSCSFWILQPLRSF